MSRRLSAGRTTCLTEQQRTASAVIAKVICRCGAAGLFNSATINPSSGAMRLCSMAIQPSQSSTSGSSVRRSEMTTAAGWRVMNSGARGSTPLAMAKQGAGSSGRHERFSRCARDSFARIRRRSRHRCRRGTRTHSCSPPAPHAAMRCTTANIRHLRTETPGAGSCCHR